MEEDELSMSKKAKTIAACAVCAAALGLGGYALFLNKETDTVPKFSEVTETAELTSEDVGVLPLGWAENIDYAPSSDGMTERAKSLLRVNKDIVGWLKIDGLQLDYPVVKPMHSTLTMTFTGTTIRRVLSIWTTAMSSEVTRVSTPKIRSSTAMQCGTAT